MGKIWGILFMVLGVWIGMEIYTSGMQNAFGGALAWFAEPIKSDQRELRSDGGTVPQRVGARVAADIYTDYDRKTKALGERNDAQDDEDEDEEGQD